MRIFEYSEKRICMCGSLFIPVDEAHDNLCKRCLLREYLALRARLDYIGGFF